MFGIGIIFNLIAGIGLYYYIKTKIVNNQNENLKINGFLLGFFSSILIALIVESKLLKFDLTKSERSNLHTGVLFGLGLSILLYIVILVIQ